MNSWHCKTLLIWGGDNDTEEQFNQQEYDMVTNLSCPNCGSFVEVYLPKKNKNEKKDAKKNTR